MNQSLQRNTVRCAGINLKNWFRMVLLIALLNAIGCAGKVDLIREGKYSVEELNTREVDVKETTVYVEHNRFIVTGSLYRAVLSSYLPGHVDVAVFGSDGNIIEYTSVPHSVPFITNKRRISYFEAKFLRIPPEGSSIRVGFHKEKLQEDIQFDCGANSALLDENVDNIK